MTPSAGRTFQTVRRFFVVLHRFTSCYIVWGLYTSVARYILARIAEWMFRWLLRGKSVEDIIAEHQDPKPSAQEVRETIAKERGKFEDECLRQVIANARAGDVTAIDWLSKRGLFASVKLPK